MSFTCVDISLFDELEDLGDADELLEALVQSVGYVSQTLAKAICQNMLHVYQIWVSFSFFRIAF